MIEEQLVAIVEGDEAIAALVADRIYPLMLPPEPTLPALVWQRIDTRDDHTHDGPGLVHPRFQWTCWASSLNGALLLYGVLDKLLDGYHANGITVLAAGAHDDEDVGTTVPGEEHGRRCRYADYIVSHTKAA